MILLRTYKLRRITFLRTTVSVDKKRIDSLYLNICATGLYTRHKTGVQLLGECLKANLTVAKRCSHLSCATAPLSTVQFANMYVICYRLLHVAKIVR